MRGKDTGINCMTDLMDFMQEVCGELRAASVSGKKLGLVINTTLLSHLRP